MDLPEGKLVSIECSRGVQETNPEPGKWRTFEPVGGVSCKAVIQKNDGELVTVYFEDPSSSDIRTLADRWEAE